MVPYSCKIALFDDDCELSWQVLDDVCGGPRRRWDEVPLRGHLEEPAQA